MTMSFTVDNLTLCDKMSKVITLTLVNFQQDGCPHLLDPKKPGGQQRMAIDV